MKKALALVMAIAMVASMAAVAMATNLNPSNDYDGYSRFSGSPWTYSKAAGWKNVTGQNVTFGTTVYIPLVADNSVSAVPGEDAALDKYVTKADAVSNIKVSAKWEENGEYVKGVSIAKVDGIYCVAIATTGHELEAVNVIGEISLSGKTADKTGDTVTKTSVKGQKCGVEIVLGYGDVIEAGALKQEVAVKSKEVYDFDGISEEEYEIIFKNGTATTAVVETYMKNTGETYIAYNETENDELLDAYVDADLLFYNFVASFRRTATVTLYAEEGSYLYEVVDGQLVEVDAEYDEWEEAFVWKTRTLGNYVVSDVELEVAAEEVVATNPSTGAAA